MSDFCQAPFPPTPLRFFLFWEQRALLYLQDTASDLRFRTNSEAFPRLSRIADRQQDLSSLRT